MILGIDASNLRGGGGVTHLRSLLAHFVRGRHGVDEIHIWAGEPTLRLLPRKPGIELEYDPVLDRGALSRLIWQRRGLPTALRAEGCDLLFSPGGTSPELSIPSVVMCQNMLPFSRGERARYGLTLTRARLEALRHFQTKSFRSSSGVIFLSDHARNEISPTLPRSVLSTVIPHGVDDEFRRTPSPPHAIADYDIDKPFRILYVSIVDVYKHQWNVVRAVRRLREVGLPVILDLVGPSYPAALRRLRSAMDAADPQRTYIQYSGPVSHGDLPRIYASADLFVFASTCENMPIILAEAMASALPIASSNTGPMPEVLGDAGLYFDPESPEEIEEALRSLIENHELRARLARSAAERSDSLQWRTCADRTFEFLASNV